MVANRKTGGGPGEDGRGKPDIFERFEKTRGGPGEDGTSRNIGTILQKAPVSFPLDFECAIFAQYS